VLQKHEVVGYGAHAQRLGLKAIDLLTPEQFAPLKEHGLICSMTSGVNGGITSGFNRKENHEKINESLRKLVDANAANGYPNVHLLLRQPQWHG